MSVGLLILTHGNVGQSLYDAATSVLGSCPLTTQVVAMHFRLDRDDIFSQVKDRLTEINSGDGVLILTDMYGATPSNIACSIKQKNISIVSGVNLPMMLSVLNYPKLPLLELTVKAIETGTEGIFLCRNKKD